MTTETAAAPYTKGIVLNNENAEAYIEYRNVLLAEWDPATQTEQDFVMDIVDARWRLTRYGAIETAALDLEMDAMMSSVEGIDVETHTALGFQAMSNRGNMYQALQAATRQQHRIIDRAVNQLMHLRKLRPAQSQTIAVQEISKNPRNEPAKAAAASAPRLNSGRTTPPNLNGVREQVGIGDQNDLPFALQGRVTEIDLRHNPVEPGDGDMIAA
jgi:hypothetical protein